MQHKHDAILCKSKDGVRDTLPPAGKARYRCFMANLDDIRDRLQAAELEQDLDAVDAQRTAFLELAPDGAERDDVQFRHALSLLLRHGDVDGALSGFKEIAGRKGGEISHEARISYALCLAAKKKRQQAIFELRRVVGQGQQISAHSVQALDFLSIFLREAQADAGEIEKVFRLRVEHCRGMVEQAQTPDERGHYLLRLGAAWSDQGGPKAFGEAREVFQQVIKLGQKLPAEMLSAAKEQLRTLPR